MQYLQIFFDKEVYFKLLDDAECGRLLTAMMHFAQHAEEIELTGNERYVWPAFKEMIEQSKAALGNEREHLHV